MNLANLLSNHSQFDVLRKKSFNSIQLHTIVRHLKQFNFCLDKTKPTTFLQKSLSSSLCHSFLYRSAIFDMVLSLSHLSWYYFKTLLLVFSSSLQSALFCFFQLLVIIFRSTHLLSIQHNDAETTVFPITLTSSCLNFTASPPDLYINSNSCLCMKSPLVEIPELFQFPVAVIIRSIYQILRSKGSIYSILCSKKFVNTTTEIRLANIKKVPRVIQVFFLCLSKIL